jgi:hypothetical protein
MNETSELYSQLIERYREHKKWAENKIKYYKPMGYLLAILIPVLAALIATLFSKDSECLDWKCGAIYFSLLLAFLSILQSTLKPSERFIYFSSVCIELEEWYFNFRIKYEQIIHDNISFNDESIKNLQKDESANKNSEARSDIMSFLIEQNKLLSEIGKKMAINTLPKGKS